MAMENKIFVFFVIFFTVSLGIMSYLTLVYVNNIQKEPVYACTIGVAVPQERLDQLELQQKAFGWDITCGVKVDNVSCPEGYNISLRGYTLRSDKK